MNGYDLTTQITLLQETVQKILLNYSAFLEMSS